jgi:uncharacterized membrane protein
VALEQDARLDPVVDTLGRLTGPFRRRPARAALGGDWMGHALHPSLTDLPLGLWTATTVLDLFGGSTARPAAQRLLGIGLLSAAPTAASGWVEWHRIERPVQRVGVVHAALNVTAVALYASSWTARRRHRHGAGRALALAGAGAAAAAGYLGGHLTSARKVSSRHPAFDGAGPGAAVAGGDGSRAVPWTAGGSTDGAFDGSSAGVGGVGNPATVPGRPAPDLLEAVTAQHARIRIMLHELGTADTGERASALRHLLAYLAGHEAVEEELLHPRVPAVDGGDIGAERLREEAGVALQIERLEQLGGDSQAFATQLSLIEEAVTRHAQAEELEELPGLAEQLSAADAAVVVRAFAAQEAWAQTRSGSFAEMLEAAKREVRHLASTQA